MGQRGRGLPDLLQYYIGRGLPNLLKCYKGGFFKVYYNITDLVGIWKGLDHFQCYICFYVVLKETHFVSNFEKNCENAIRSKDA